MAVYNRTAPEEVNCRHRPRLHRQITECWSTPTFEWTPVEGADYYVLHSNRLDPTEMVVVEDVTEQPYSPAEPLADGTVYHWRVQAVADDGAEGEWSGVWEFEIEENMRN